MQMKKKTTRIVQKHYFLLTLQLIARNQRNSFISRSEKRYNIVTVYSGAKSRDRLFVPNIHTYFTAFRYTAREQWHIFGNVQISDEQDDFQIFKETGMPTSLSNVERRHSRFFENYENHCAAEHKHF
jgi:hypothetical protein